MSEAVLGAVGCGNGPPSGSGWCGSKGLGTVQTARAWAEGCWDWILPWSGWGCFLARWPCQGYWCCCCCCCCSHHYHCLKTGRKREAGLRPRFLFNIRALLRLMYSTLKFSFSKRIHTLGFVVYHVHIPKALHCVLSTWVGFTLITQPRRCVSPDSTTGPSDSISLQLHLYSFMYLLYQLLPLL